MKLSTSFMDLSMILRELASKLCLGTGLSQTILHVNQNTNGHYHEGQEEVYFFMYGKGSMQVGDDLYNVEGGDIVLIPDGLFHKVWNTGESDLVFNCVFDGKRNH
jgi:oxalate decarboxylase/phosphoglucose isomerase-like protein (cupin superfamily)